LYHFSFLRICLDNYTKDLTRNNIHPFTNTRPALLDEHVHISYRPAEHGPFLGVSKDEAIVYQSRELARPVQRNEEPRRNARRDTKTRTPRVALYETTPELSYIEQVNTLLPDSGNHENGPQFVLNTLASIPVIGPLSTGVGLPSDHSGIAEDPVLV
jgi:hypothetical protein